MSDLDNLLNKANEQTKKFIKQLELEEKNERVETVDAILNDMKSQKMQTDINKKRFINEIKSGLGDVIKEKPNVIEIIETPWYVKFKNSIKNMFTKF